MGKETNIAWTDHTFNPWHGCTEASPGCDHCYARTVDTRWGGPSHWGKGVPRRTFNDDHWRDPIRWNKAAKAAGAVEKVFCLSMGDVMDDEAPDGARERLWDLVDQTPWLLWQFLTKRPQRYLRYLPADGFENSNVILGATTEDQQRWNERMPHLFEAGHTLHRRNGFRRANTARVQIFASYEPAIGPIIPPGLMPDWVIFGGETGPERRPMELAWAKQMAWECEHRGAAFFMKQMTAANPAKAAALIPAEMLIRQFPETR